MNINGEGTVVALEPEVPGFRELLYHELAHYYANARLFPKWLSEGTADFLASCTLHVDENISLQSRRDIAREDIATHCEPRHGMNNVRRWLGALSRPHDFNSLQGQQALGYCPYPLGEVFLQGMYDARGNQIVSSILRESYQAAQNQYRPLSEGQIYQAFLSNVPPAQQEEFRELYRRLHGEAAGYSPDIDVPAAIPNVAALVALYRATSGENWERNENWLTEVSSGLCAKVRKSKKTG